jgi:dihydroorotase
MDPLSHLKGIKLMKIKPTLLIVLISLVLVDLDRTHVVENKNVICRCGWSPVEGYSFRSTVEMTMVNGRIVYQNGQVVDSPQGLPLEFER